MTEADLRKLAAIASSLSVHHADIEIIKDHEKDDGIINDLEEVLESLDSACEKLNTVLES